MVNVLDIVEVSSTNGLAASFKISKCSRERLFLSPQRELKTMSFRAAWSSLLQTFIRFSILLDSIRQLSRMQYFKVTVSKCAFSLPGASLCSLQDALREAAHQTALKGSVIISEERVWSGRGEGTLSLMLPFKVIEFVGWIHRIRLQQEHITA